MITIILNTTSRLLMGLLLVFSVFLLLRGHNLPGGGFAGGLVAAAAFSLETLTHGPKSARALLRIDPRTLIGIGLAVAALSGCVGLFAHHPYMTGVWNLTPLPVVGKLGTPLLFDVGVYIVVTGITLLIVLALAEGDERERRY